MAVVYIVTVLLVTALLLSIPLFPFWKVWTRLKAYPDIWNAKGPFDLMSLLGTPALAGDFIDVLIEIKKDEHLKRRDPYLVKWAAMAVEIYLMLPRSFVAQVGWFILFMYFTGVLTSVLLSPFKG
jgi:hypothetical protein